MIQNKEAQRLSDLLKLFQNYIEFDLYVSILVGSETINHKLGSYTLNKQVLSNALDENQPNEICASKLNLSGFYVKSIELDQNKLIIYAKPCTPIKETVNYREQKERK